MSEPTRTDIPPAAVEGAEGPRTAPQPSKQELAYSILRQRILDGTYGPGYRLIIDALAKELGTSPIPVREAVRRLEAEGLVEYQPFSGARVALPDETAYRDAFSTLAVLEGYATAMAAPHVTEADREELRGLNREMRAAIAALDVLTYSRLNRAFHALIRARCPNAYLREAIDHLMRQLDAMRRTVFAFVPNRSAESLEEHEELLELLAGGAPPEAVEAFAREHKMRTLRAFEAWERETRLRERS
ncbi:MAG: GntR family transcriptional regulator [Firmicutes bacterium]|nr:GntR family transcriptional regulator [Bacillota bacterium]